MNFATYELGYCLLYKVALNGVDTNYYTSSKTQVIYGGNTYVPASIEKSSYSKEGNADPSTITLKIPVNEYFISRISSFAPIIAAVYIYIISTTEVSPTAVLLFKGDVTEIKTDGKYIAEVTLAEDILPTQVPELFIQPACNHSLFSAGCGLDSSLWKEEIVISSLFSTISLASADLVSFAANYFERGTAIYGNEVRYITASSTLAIEINLPFESNVVSKTVTIYPGCNKIAATCVAKFNNFNKFLGFVKVPKKNPIFSSI